MSLIIYNLDDFTKFEKIPSNKEIVLKLQIQI